MQAFLGERRLALEWEGGVAWTKGHFLHEH